MKWLRVARLGLERKLNEDDLPLIPKAYYDIYADPRLSEVARLMNCTKISGNPVHLDLDWFGAGKSNWWKGEGEGVDGPAWQLAVAGGLVNLLEKSFGLGPSGPEFESWTWDGTSYGSQWESLELEPTPTAPPTPITVVWVLDKDLSNVQPAAVVDLGGALGWELTLRTPVPKKNRDTILQ